MPFEPSWWTFGHLIEIDYQEGAKYYCNKGELPQDFKMKDLPSNLCTFLVEGVQFLSKCGEKV